MELVTINAYFFNYQWVVLTGQALALLEVVRW